MATALAGPARCSPEKAGEPAIDTQHSAAQVGHDAPIGRIRMLDQRQEREAGEARRTAALMGAIVILALAIVSIMLIRALGKEARMEDCLMSGRTNCAPIEMPLDRD
jgi:hypothetical protein